MSKIKSTCSHILRDTKHQAVVMDDTGPIHDPDAFANRIAFTSLLTHPNGKIYCGLTSFNTDILASFDTKTRKFAGLGYDKVAEKYEVKIHRSLALDNDGVIYGASACLYRLDKRHDAPGGSLFRYDPKVGRIEKLGIPVPRDYAQTITLDAQRGLIYGMTQPVLKFFVYHLDSGRTDDFDFMGSITHLGALDDDGCYWGTWDESRHHLFKYDPRLGKIVYFDHGIPEGAKFADIMYRGAGPVDCMLNGGDGYLYIGTTGGTLCRLDPRTAEVKYLGRPYPTKRLPGLALIDERRILCAGGDEEGGYLALYDRKTNGIEHLGALVDEQGTKLYRTHDLTVSLDRRTAYVAETDVPHRSGRLWECALEL